MELAALLALAAAASSGLPPAHPDLLRRVSLVVLALAVVTAVPARAALGPPQVRSMGGPGAVTEVRVEPGDSLWAIARRLLVHRGIEPSSGRVDRYWRTLYEANREVIGSDPDLILPGQRLIAPLPETR